MLAINWKEVAEGRATALYQPVHDGDKLWAVGVGEGWGGVINGNQSRYRFEVGKDYALQAAGNARAIWWRYLGELQTTLDHRAPAHLRTASEGYLRADGWVPLLVHVVAIGAVADIRTVDLSDSGMSQEEYWAEWVSRYDRSWQETFAYANDCNYLLEYGFFERPANRYAAWRLEVKRYEYRFSK